MITSENVIREWLSIAKEAALLAGAFLSGNRGPNLGVKKESGRDVKLTADIESEKIILNYLKEKSDFSILSEESGLIKRSRQELKWVVDPLDGTFNYMRGIPLCCISIGLWQADNPVLGVVYEFNRSELFSGIAKKGAWLNDSPISASGIIKKERAVLCTGFPVNTEFSKKNIQIFVENVSSYKKIRLLGSAALSIAYVASGRVDVYQERDIMLWDVGGAIPILLGAGGKLNMNKAPKIYSYHIFACNGLMAMPSDK